LINTQQDDVTYDYMNVISRPTPDFQSDFSCSVTTKSVQIPHNEFCLPTRVTQFLQYKSS